MYNKLLLPITAVLNVSEMKKRKGERSRYRRRSHQGMQNCTYLPNKSAFIFDFTLAAMHDLAIAIRLTSSDLWCRQVPQMMPIWMPFGALLARTLSYAQLLSWHSIFIISVI